MSDYQCHRFDGRVKTSHQWLKEHGDHGGYITMQTSHPSGKVYMRTCCCGAKHIYTIGEEHEANIDQSGCEK
jgi:hypothetical protein